MTISALMKKTIENYSKRVAAKLLTNLYVVYYEVFNRVDYSDRSIRNIFVQIVNENHILLYFYVRSGFDLAQSKRDLDDLKFRLEEIDFDYTIISFISPELIGDESFIKLK